MDGRHTLAAPAASNGKRKGDQVEDPLLLAVKPFLAGVFSVDELERRDHIQIMFRFEDRLGKCLVIHSSVGSYMFIKPFDPVDKGISAVHEIGLGQKNGVIVIETVVFQKLCHLFLGPVELIGIGAALNRCMLPVEKLVKIRVLFEIQKRFSNLIESLVHGGSGFLHQKRTHGCFLLLDPVGTVLKDHGKAHDRHQEDQEIGDKEPAEKMIPWFDIFAEKFFG